MLNKSSTCNASRVAIVVVFSFCNPLLFGMTPSSPAQAQEIETKEEESVAGDENVALSPKQVYLEVNKALFAANVGRIEGLVAPIVAKQPKEFIKNLTPEVGEQLAKYMANVSAIDGEEFGDLAIIIKVDRGKSFTDGLDTDPLLLHKIDGQWKLILDEGPTQAAYINDAGLSDAFGKAISWYRETEPIIRKQLLESSGVKPNAG